MPVEPLPSGAVVHLWGDCMVNRIAVICALILLVLELVDLLRMYPYLFRCVIVWKGNLDLEHSMSLARTRNTLALVMMVILCLVLDRWELVNPSFNAALPEEWHIAVVAGLLFAYVLLHSLLYMVSRFRSRTADYDSTLRHSVYNYQILLSTLLLVTAILLTALKVPQAAVRIVLLVETAAFALLHLLRSGQILASRCSIFVTFLYLCALEILPLGLLVFVCTL